MAHIILHFTEQELRDLQETARATDGEVRVEWRRFGVLARAFLDHTTIREQLRESGIDTKSGGTPHAVSRLIGVHMATQRMAEGAGVVPAPLLAAASKELLATQVLLEKWRTWAAERVLDARVLDATRSHPGISTDSLIKQIDLTDASSPRTDSAMMEYLGGRLRSG